MDFTQQLFSDAPLVLGQILFWAIFALCGALWFFLARALAGQVVASIPRTADKKLEKVESGALRAAGQALVGAVVLGCLLAYLLLPVWAGSAALLMGVIQVVVLLLVLAILSLVLRRNR